MLPLLYSMPLACSSQHVCLELLPMGPDGLGAENRRWVTAFWLF